MWRSVAAKSGRVTQILDKVLLGPSSNSSQHLRHRFLSISSSSTPTLEETPPPPTPTSGFDFPSAPIQDIHAASVDDELLVEEDADETAVDSEQLDETVNFSSIDEYGVVREIDREKLEAVLSLLQSSADGSLESTLNGLEIDLHVEFVLRVVETPNLLGENLIRFFNWARSKPGGSVMVTSQSLNAVIQAICGDCVMRKKDAYALWDLIMEVVSGKGDDDVTILNARMLNPLIELLSKLGKAKAAFEVFNKLEEFGCVPDSDTYYFTIEALCRRSFFDWAWTVCEKMMNASALPEDPNQVGKIVSWFCRANRPKDAHTVFVLAKEKNRSPPQSVTNYLVASLSHKDDTVKLALEMLDGYTGEVRKYAIKPFSSVMHGLCRSKDVTEAKSLLTKMIADGPPPGNAIFNLLINAYSKDGNMGGAMGMMKLMKKRGLKPDVYTYTVAMSGFVSGGSMEEARRLLKEAKKMHTKLCPVTYHTLIRGYCKLEQYDEALSLLAEMEQFGVQASVDEYTKLIQSLCLKALDWRRAEELLGRMKESGLHLNGITKGLIGAVKELDEEESSVEKISVAA
ncbi:Pentatricopeptide repeat-containing protein At3g02650, mitochondrial [Linum perenne]